MIDRYAVFIAAAVACIPVAVAQAPRSPTPAAVDAPITATQVATGLEHPWGLAMLPDGRMLVTERPGRLRIVDKDGKLSPPLTGVPAVYAQRQGGLLGVALSPRFATDQLVYLSYSEPGRAVREPLSRAVGWPATRWSRCK